MANKGQITEDDLRSGLEGFGTFSTLTGGRPKRDNPFRATTPAPEAQALAPSTAPLETPERLEKEVPSPVTKADQVSVPEPLKQAAPNQAAELQKSEVAPAIKTQSVVVVELPKTAVIEEAPLTSLPSSSPIPQKAQAKRVGEGTKPPRTVKPAEKPKEAPPQASSEEGAAARERKLDIFTEMVTLRLTPDMRDSVERLARDFQRNKTSKTERITANTVMRVAVRALIDNLEVDKYDVANTEEELYKLVCEKIIRGNGSHKEK